MKNKYVVNDIVSLVSYPKQVMRISSNVPGGNPTKLEYLDTQEYVCDYPISNKIVSETFKEEDLYKELIASEVSHKLSKSQSITILTTSDTGMTEHDFRDALDKLKEAGYIVEEVHDQTVFFGEGEAPEPYEYKVEVTKPS